MSAPLSHPDRQLSQAVHDAYSSKAREGADVECETPEVERPANMFTSCHQKDANNIALAFGYTVEQLRSIPAESYIGLSCGNPVAAASIKEVSRGSYVSNCAD